MSEKHLELKIRHYNKHGLGYTDFFPYRHKRKLLDLAGLRPSDVFFDLGCGDASILICAARDYGARRAVGYENDPTRNHMAKERVRSAGLESRITIEWDMNEADLSQADAIFWMLPEHDGDYEAMLHLGMRKGARLIKHDLPLLGFEFDGSDYPFYRMDFPFRLASSPSEWASSVLRRRGSTIDDVWQELYYYGYEKGYTKWDINRFKRIVSKRFSK